MTDLSDCDECGERVLSHQARQELKYVFLNVKKMFNGFYSPLKKKARLLGLAHDEQSPEKGTEKRTDKDTEKSEKKSPEKEGKGVTMPNTDEQQRGLAAAFTASLHESEKDLIAAEMHVSLATVDKYLSILSSPGNEDLVKMVRTNGRPRMYSLAADISFIEWAMDEENPLNEKTLPRMIHKYLEILFEESPRAKSLSLSINGVRQHIYLILRFMNWCMVKPATIDVARCAVLDRMLEWFKKAEVEESLTSVDSKLLFDADETQITLEEKSPKKVLSLCKGGKNSAVVPHANRASRHITLFLTVSAAGDIMKPYVLLSDYVRGFDPLHNKDVVHFHVPSGYMTQDVFFMVMRDVFVKYVESVRSYYNLEGRRAVLVVDGHISRYTTRTVELLMEHNIDMVIIPSHSTHVMQPLDLGLFAILKRAFNDAMVTARPVFPLEERRTVGRPSNKKKIAEEKLSDVEFRKHKQKENADLLRGVQEENEDTDKRIGRAVYKRAQVIEALIDAISALKPSVIRHAWNHAHIYPFYGTPNYSREKEKSLLRQIPKAERDFLLRKDDEEEVQASEVVEESMDAEESSQDDGVDVLSKKRRRRKKNEGKKEEEEEEVQASELAEESRDREVDKKGKKAKKRRCPSETCDSPAKRRLDDDAGKENSEDASNKSYEKDKKKT